MELQEQLSTLNRDLRAVKVRLATLQRDSRANSVTSKQVEAFDSSVPLYRAIGKAFFTTPKDKLQLRLQQESAELEKTQKDLMDRQEYLERRIASCSTNLQELIK